MLNKILENLKQNPNYICYQIKDKTYTNQDLYKYVCNIYTFLVKEKNCKKQEKVLVYGHKEIYMIASFLACAFAGLTYVPVDITTPDIRKKKIIEQVNPKIIVDNGIENIMYRDNYIEISKIDMKDEDVFYIIFTSGSTGEPKGVQITYSNLKSCTKWLKDICNIENTVILNQANFSFDLSVADIYLSLLTKSKHYIIERNTQKNFKLLFQELQKSNATFAVFTPSFADLLLVDKNFNKSLMPNLQKILFCGEKLTKNTVDKLYSRFKNIKIINSYGPTECTFAVTSTEIKSNEEDISIGKPKQDVCIYVVDENLQELKESEIGEILIFGKSVGKGYLNPSLNKNHFINFKNEKTYRTGDLGYKKDGKFYCIGRKDKQIKYNGYRIELSEIEKAFYTIEYIEKVIVTTTKNDEGKINKIIAFVKEKENYEISKQDLKREISKTLPEYMIPRIKIVKTIPINENGKIDERTLLEELNERKNNKNDN